MIKDRAGIGIYQRLARHSYRLKSQGAFNTYQMDSRSECGQLRC